MTKIIPFKIEHLECMDMREHEKQMLSSFSPEILSSGIAVTGIVDGRIICCGGVVPHLNGNAEIWLVPSIWVSKYKFTFVKELRRWLFKVRSDLCLNRMQTTCINDKLHEGWLVSLGFEKEGIMRKYHNGEDYALFGRVEWE